MASRGVTCCSGFFRCNNDDWFRYCRRRIVLKQGIIQSEQQQSSLSLGVFSVLVFDASAYGKKDSFRFVGQCLCHVRLEEVTKWVSRGYKELKDYVLEIVPVDTLQNIIE